MTENTDRFHDEARFLSSYAGNMFDERTGQEQSDALAAVVRAGAASGSGYWADYPDEAEKAVARYAETRNAHRTKNAAAVQRTAERLLEAAVAADRDEGASWADIGIALGVSRQAAQQRFGGV